MLRSLPSGPWLSSGLRLLIWVYSDILATYFPGLHVVHCLCRKPISISAPPQKYDSQWYVVKYIEQLARFHQVSKLLKLRSYPWLWDMYVLFLQTSVLSLIGSLIWPNFPFFFSLCTVHVPADLRQSLHPPLSGAKHLDFTMRLLTNRDFWLWISPHAGTVFRISKQKEIYFPRLCSFFSFKLWKLYTYTPQCMLLSGLNYMCLIVRA